MKKNLLFAFFILILGCKKNYNYEDNIYHVTFWSNSDKPHYIYVDGKYVGCTKKNEPEPYCGQPTYVIAHIPLGVHYYQSTVNNVFNKDSVVFFNLKNVCKTIEIK